MEKSPTKDKVEKTPTKDMVEKSPSKDTVEKESRSGSRVSNGKIIEMGTTHLINPEAARVKSSGSGKSHRLSGEEEPGGTTREPTVRVLGMTGTTVPILGRDTAVAKAGIIAAIPTMVLARVLARTITVPPRAKEQLRGKCHRLRRNKVISGILQDSTPSQKAASIEVQKCQPRESIMLPRLLQREILKSTGQTPQQGTRVSNTPSALCVAEV